MPKPKQKVQKDPEPLKHGDRIKLDPITHFAAKAALVRKNDAQALAETAGNLLRQAHESLWETIKAANPELNDWEMIYESTTGEVVLTRPISRRPRLEDY